MRRYVVATVFWPLRNASFALEVHLARDQWMLREDGQHTHSFIRVCNADTCEFNDSIAVRRSITPLSTAVMARSAGEVDGSVNFTT